MDSATGTGLAVSVGGQDSGEASVEEASEVFAIAPSLADFRVIASTSTSASFPIGVIPISMDTHGGQLHILTTTPTIITTATIVTRMTIQITTTIAIGGAGRTTGTTIAATMIRRITGATAIMAIGHVWHRLL